MAPGTSAIPILTLYMKLPAENRGSADLERVPLKLDECNDNDDGADEEEEGDDLTSCMMGDIMADALVLKGESILRFDRFDSISASLLLPAPQRSNLWETKKRVRARFSATATRISLMQPNLRTDSETGRLGEKKKGPKQNLPLRALLHSFSLSFSLAKSLRRSASLMR